MTDSCRTRNLRNFLPILSGSSLRYNFLMAGGVANTVRMHFSIHRPMNEHSSSADGYSSSVNGRLSTMNTLCPEWILGMCVKRFIFSILSLLLDLNRTRGHTDRIRYGPSCFYTLFIYRLYSASKRRPVTLRYFCKRSYGIVKLGSPAA